MNWTGTVHEAVQHQHSLPCHVQVMLLLKLPELKESHQIHQSHVDGLILDLIALDALSGEQFPEEDSEKTQEF